MAIKVGDKVPSVKLKRLGANGMEEIDTAELFAGKKVVMFGLPGAFTPTCSARHLPGFIDKRDDLAAKGVDKVYCLAVNDAFVMKAWGEGAKAGDKVELLPDGNGDFTRALGLELDGRGYGLGQRCQRFALTAEDGVVTDLQVEQPGAFDVSSAEAVLARL